METPPGRSESTRQKSSGNNGSRPKSTALVPTNTVTTKSGVTVRARIDPTLTVDDVVRQLCINLKIRDPPAKFALRDETDELVTNDNLRKMIKAKLNLKCVGYPFLHYGEYIYIYLTTLCNIGLSMLQLLKRGKSLKS